MATKTAAPARTKKTGNPSTPRDLGVPMADRLPGAMTEAMVKGSLVSESTNPEHNHSAVAQMGWGTAIHQLIEVRGGNMTYNDWLAERSDSEVKALIVKSLPDPAPIKITRLGATGEIKSRDEMISLKQVDDDDFSDLDDMLAEIDDDELTEFVDHAVGRPAVDLDADLNPTFPVEAIPDDVPTAKPAKKHKIKAPKKSKKPRPFDPAVEVGPPVHEDEHGVDLDDLLAEFDEVEYVPTIEESGHALFIGMPTTRDYIFDGHAGAGPSGSERWMNCTASLGAARAFLETLTPNQQMEFAKGSEAARQGTTAHAAAESEALFMLGKITESEHEMNLLELSMLPESETEAYDAEMGEWIEEYGDLIKQFHQDGHEILVEAKVEAAIPLMTVTDGERDVHVIAGSADFIALPLPEEPVLTVGDLKYGNGLDVDAEDNSQEKIYALGVLALLIEKGLDIFDPEVLARIDLIIIQPRLGGIKTWSTTVDELLDWQDEVLSPALTEALAGIKGGAKFSPSDTACQWCPARGNCAALAEQRHEAAADLFDEIQEVEYEQGVGTLLDSGALTAERLAELLAQAEGLIKIRDDLKAEAQRRLHRGEEVPGFQLVNYTPPRKWAEDVDKVLDPAEVDEDFLDPQIAAELWKHELRTPTQALKILKTKGIPEEKLDALIEVFDKRPVVAREGDRRKTWEGRPPEAMFDDETGTDAG